MSKKVWIIFVAVCVALLAVLVYASGKNRVDVSNVNPQQLQKATKADGHIADHIFGKADSPVVLIEYGDFQCPYCGDAYPQVKTVTDKYQGQIAYVFRNFPLTTAHPNALAAAAAAEAAGLQGKYWQMHDTLYEGQSDWSNDTISQRATAFKAYAKELGLNVDKFTSDMDSSAVRTKIDFDLALGGKAGVSGTPTFFLDGKKVSNNVLQNVMQGDGSQLDAAIAAALKAHHIALPKTAQAK